MAHVSVQMKNGQLRLLTGNADVVEGRCHCTVCQYGHVLSLLDREVVAGPLPDHVEPVDHGELNYSRRCRRDVLAVHAGCPVIVASSQSNAGDALRVGLLGEVEPAPLVERCARQEVQVSGDQNGLARAAVSARYKHGYVDWDREVLSHCGPGRHTDEHEGCESGDDQRTWFHVIPP